MKAHLLEELVDALTDEHRIKPKGIREKALLLYLNTNPTLKLDGAIALWRKGRISLAKASEISGLTVPEFKDVLAAKGIFAKQRARALKRWMRIKISLAVKTAISDTDILSSFGKVGRTDLLQRLFLKIYAAPAVYGELTRAEQLGLAWVTAAKEAVELLPLTETQSKEVEQLATACPQH